MCFALLRVLDLQTGVISLQQIKSATDNFASANKIGEGGFGSVYKGILGDGTTIAVKQLSAKSRQGSHEFCNNLDRALFGRGELHLDLDWPTRLRICTDFGLVKLYEEENTHITTRVAGTICVMFWGCCKKNTKFSPDENYVCLLDWAHNTQENEKLMELVDPRFLLKDYEIEHEAQGADKAVKPEVKAVAEDKTLPIIRFVYTGKGTTAVPFRGASIWLF
ncbi:hypothetical protein POM88_014311 [Heracleum sosnowskyi]|uniref:Protein kinase domain-containing protein n=1 Tax=Heracleum sosnowskyi TaxID=360622 RepID=A0AAD8J056_9APIA|nr:hypothetical protein POM88_014311 [Heracleum sosnowskyi]